MIPGDRWPIRARLTLWYTAVLAAVLLGLAAVSYALLRRQVALQTEQGLAETARTVLVSMRAVGAATPPRQRARAVAEAASRFRYPDRRVLFYDGLRPLGGSAPPEEAAGREPFLVSPEAPELRAALAAGTRDVLLPAPGPGLSPVRAHIRPPRRGGARLAVVVLGSTRDEEEFLRDVRAYFALFIPLSLLVAALVGYFLAAKSLAPVDAIIRQAERMGAADLDARLPVANPRDELGRLARVLNSLLDRLRDAFALQRRFMADAAHELRTPVAVIRGEAEVTLSRQDRASAEYRDSLAVVAGEAQRLTGIVDDLFILARADAGQVPLRPAPVYLEELVAETVRALATLAAGKGIELKLDAPAELPFTGDEALLRRLLTNVLENAVKFTPPGGRIAVIAARRGPRYLVTVSDTGAGVLEADRERIFERFHRAQTEPPGEPSEHGAGLGLPIARWIARAHGGELLLAASGPSGSSFVIELPAGAEPDPKA